MRRAVSFFALTLRARPGIIEFVFLLKFAARIAANAGALWIADRLLTGFNIIPHAAPILDRVGIEPNAQALVAGGLVLAILFAFVRPILRLLSFPLIILTFGAFNIVIGITLIALADWFAAGIDVTGVIAYIGGALIIGTTNALVELFFRTS